MNFACLTGRLGQEPTLRQAGDTPVCNFTVATRGYKKDQTDWHNVVVWGKSAENCKKYLDKGSMISLNGRMQTRSWEKDGVTKYTTEVVADNVEFLDSKPKDAAPVVETPAPGIEDLPF